MPSFNEFTFLSSNGKNNVFVRECVPDGEIRGVVQIAHGIAEHSGRYVPFMEFLAGNGFVAVANDHLGHGKTAADESELCYFAPKNGWDLVVEDMDQLHRIEAAKYPDVPYFVMGHSMGSFLTRTYIIRHPNGLKGAIISGTGQNPGVVVSSGKLMAKLEIIDHGDKYRSPMLDKLAFGNYNKGYETVRTHSDWLTRDETIVDAFIADPLCGKVATAGLFYDLMTGLQFIWKTENLNKMNKAMPVYFFAGDKDPVGGNGENVKKVYNRFLKVGMQDVRLKLYKDGRHEMLNELNKDEVYADVLAWLNSKL